MDKPNESLKKLRDKIAAEINRGFNATVAADIACMIQDAEIIEAYISKHHIGGVPEGASRLLAYIEDELSAANKYHDQWKATGDATYKQIAQDELRHALAIIQQARALQLNAAEQARLHEYTSMHQTISNKLI